MGTVVFYNHKNHNNLHNLPSTHHLSKATSQSYHSVRVVVALRFFKIMPESIKSTYKTISDTGTSTQNEFKFCSYLGLRGTNPYDNDF